QSLDLEYLRRWLNFLLPLYYPMATTNIVRDYAFGTYIALDRSVFGMVFPTDQSMAFEFYNKSQEYNPPPFPYYQTYKIPLHFLGKNCILKLFPKSLE